MSQPSTLTTPPSFLSRLETEPAIEEDDGPVLNSMSFDFGGIIGDIINIGVGRQNEAAAAAAKIISSISSIADIVQIGRLGSVVLPLEQIARLGTNSPEFYCAIGAAIATTRPLLSAHVIVSQAKETQDDFPSLWYVNFPHNMSGHDAQVVKRYRDSMTDFRSWSSKKWWEEVGRRYGVADEAIARAKQSKEFAQIACEDMVKMSWLRTTRRPDTMNFRIDCESYDLHRRLVEKVMGGWYDVDAELLDTVEPVFRGIVKTALSGSRESSHMNNVVMEKYVYNSSNRSITSYIRLLSFEVHESMYDVIRGGKSRGRESRVSVALSLCLYEAVFEAALWDQFSATLHDDETDLLWDYVNGQTINVRSRH
ncbi:hypothetical protein QBC40DRAFT_331509 [Triangularia verruculosa]|uniref:Uncharacterized protein n=1 Tax=Triangularia verruculosa TaxID=2587418 RepID=A0AAN6XCU6_9PEZI|nr:hypothetical protein QBC40DRAFT_331509 [Triangularia verruculosa]